MGDLAATSSAGNGNRRPYSVPYARFPMGGSKFNKTSDLNGDVPLRFLDLRQRVVSLAALSFFQKE
jgi:hypothetical protein